MSEEAELEFVRPSFDVVKSWLGNVDIEDESDDDQSSKSNNRIIIFGRGGIGATDPKPSTSSARQEHQLRHRIVKRTRQDDPVADVDDDLTDEEACSRIQSVQERRAQPRMSAHQQCLVAAQQQHQRHKKRRKRRNKRR